MKGFLPTIILLILYCTVEANVTALRINYSVHMSNIGWGDWKENGAVAGTTGESRSIEAIKIRLDGVTTNSKASSCSLSYRAHVANLGWLEWVEDSEIAGTTGQSLALEAIEIKLQNCDGWKISYRAHIAESGWLSLVTDGELAGSTGQAKAMEAIKIHLFPQDCGINWQEQFNEIGNHWITDIGWNGKQWIVTGNNGAILTSDDAINWQKQVSGTTDSINAIKWNGVNWLAIGGGYNEHFILVSQDGVDWKQVYTTEKNTPLGALEWDGNNWYVIGFGEVIILNADGLEWEKTTYPYFDYINNVIWNGNTWMASGYYGSLAASSDGINWERQPYSLNVRVSPPDIYKTLHDLAWNGNHWIAVGGSHYNGSLVSTVLTSPDGFDWQKQPSALGKELYAVDWNGLQWVAVGGSHNYNNTEGTIMTCADGSHWQKQETPINKPLSNIKWNGYQWLAIGANGTILSSVDGIDWQNHSIDTFSDFTEIAWNGSQWVVAGSNGQIFSSNCSNNNSCIAEAAHFDESSGLLHIKNLKIEGGFGSTKELENISLQHIENSEPIAFKLEYLNTHETNQLCSNEQAILSYSGLITIPSARYSATSGDSQVFNNLIFQLNNSKTIIELKTFLETTKSP